MVGIGIIPAYGISTTSTITRVIEWTIPATGVRTPFLMFAAVRAMAPVAGIPPNNAEAMFPAPCATNSISERCFPLIMPSATTQESRDSIAARIAMVNAFGIAACTISKFTVGRWKDGSALLIVYRFPMVETFNGRNFTIKIPTITAIREPGIFLKI